MVRPREPKDTESQRTFIIGSAVRVEMYSAPAQRRIPAAPVAEEEELADDTELVAVIAAAIAAYEGTSTDGFQVRSIKRASTRKWKNA